jgi:formate C-acetyltransferase
MERLDPRIARMKNRLLSAPYEICMARALHFTRAYRETEGMDPSLRNAAALKRTLERQKIFISPDEFLAGNATEKFLSCPLSVERGDFLRTLELELDVLHLKYRPFVISKDDCRAFLEEILPYWNGRTVRDEKAREWEKRGLTRAAPGLAAAAAGAADAVRYARYVGRSGLRLMAGAARRAPLTLDRIRTIHRLRFELARNNPTPAAFCFDVQGHLSLGVDKVVTRGMRALVGDAQRRMARLPHDPAGNGARRSFLEAVIISLEAAIDFAARHADLAEELAKKETAGAERRRLSLIAEHLRRVPGERPRTFHEALQAVWIVLVVGQIQYGTHEVFAVGRCDQYLHPFFARDTAAGRLTRAGAIALLQEFFLKLSTSVEPIPEIGMETNAVLGNSQRCVTIGGLRPDGKDGTNELSHLMLLAHDIMKGAINQLSVRLHAGSPPGFARRAAEVFRNANGIAFYNDGVIVKALLSDGYSARDARDYCVVGCIETSGQSDTHGCPGGHEIVLPAVLSLALTRGKLPPPAPGQMKGHDSGDPAAWRTFDKLAAGFREQLAHQISVLVSATAGKDQAYLRMLPAPYVSALMDGCIENATDITAGGAKYDFTSIDVRGLATLVDSLMAIKTFVFDRRELVLSDFIRTLLLNFEGNEALRQRLLREAPKYGNGNAEADAMAVSVVGWVSSEAEKYKNIRGGRFRVCFYSYGNHVIDGLVLSATPDGRRRGEPISNGVSPSNLFSPAAGPAGPMRAAAKLPPEKVSSGVSLNMRFHPSFIETERGLDTYTGLIRTYFSMGGMHLQPNVVSTEVLRDAQAHPERHRDLVVKVSGYSAYFCDLGRSIQEDIIARAEFGAT